MARYELSEYAQQTLAASATMLEISHGSALANAIGLYELAVRAAVQGKKLVVASADDVPEYEVDFAKS